MASDGLIDNAVSIASHARLGYREVEPLVHFAKDMGMMARAGMGEGLGRACGMGWIDGMPRLRHSSGRRSSAAHSSGRASRRVAGVKPGRRRLR